MTNIAISPSAAPRARKLFEPGDLLATNYFRPLGWVASSAAARNANIYYGTPIFIPTPITFDRIGINVTAAAGAGNSAILGCYKHTNGWIGALQFDAGEVAIDAIALALATINQQLTAGWWWVVSNLEASCTVDVVSSTVFAPTLGTAPNHINTLLSDGVTYPAPAVLPDPSPSTVADLSSYGVPWIYLRIASIP